MSQKKISLIEEAWNKVSEAGSIAADTVEKLDEALLAWTLAWDTYLTLEKKPNKTESEITDIVNIYKMMCSAWKVYEKALIENKDACFLAFSASTNLYFLMQKEKLN